MPQRLLAMAAFSGKVRLASKTIGVVAVAVMVRCVNVCCSALVGGLRRGAEMKKVEICSCDEHVWWLPMRLRRWLSEVDGESRDYQHGDGGRGEKLGLEFHV